MTGPILGLVAFAVLVGAALGIARYVHRNGPMWTPPDHPDKKDTR